VLANSWTKFNIKKAGSDGYFVDPEGDRKATMYTHSTTSNKKEPVAFRVSGADGDTIAYGMQAEEPRRWGTSNLSANVRKGEWAMRVNAWTRWVDGGEEGVYVNTVDKNNLLIPLSALIVPPDARQPRDMITFTTRSQLKTSHCLITMNNYVIDSAVHDEIVRLATI
jgi:hypothetical protein